MYKFLLYLIITLHTLLVLFMILIPFFGKNYLLFIHAIIGITIIIHWIANNNTCSLTIIEYKLRECITNKPIDQSDCFMARLIDPIYDFKKNNNTKSTFIYIMLWSLILLSSYKLHRNYKAGKLKNLCDFYFR